MHRTALNMFCLIPKGEVLMISNIATEQPNEKQPTKRSHIGRISREGSLETSLWLYVYLSFTVLVLLMDYTFFLIPDIKYSAALIVSTIITLLLSIGLIRLKLVRLSFGKERAKTRWVQVFGVVIIWAFTLIKVAFPESSYDAFNYHLYFQQLFNRDFLRYDFFPIRAVNAFYLVLGDRMMYVFRFLLGYRLGTVLNSFVITILYLQLTSFLREFFEIKSEVVCMIAVTIGLLTENVIWEYCSYLVDVLAVPFILELFIQSVRKERSNCIFLCLLCGFAVSIKISNVFFVAPLMLYYIITHAKEIRIYEIIVGALVAIATVGVYLLISLRITGNPLFPYLNGLFKSRYFSLTESPSEISKLKSRYGPETFLQYLLWPVYLVFHPERTSDIHYNTGRLLVVFVAIISSLVSQRGRLRKNEKIFILAWLYMYLINIFLLDGYTRYVLLLDVLGGAYVVLVIYWITKHSPCRMCPILLSAVLLVQSTILLKQYLIDNVEWSWRNNLITDRRGFVSNAKYILHDYAIEPQEALNDKEIDEWLSVNYNGSIAVLLDNTVPIVGMRMAATNEYTNDLLSERLQDLETKNVYTYSTVYDLDECLAILEQNDLSIEEIETIETNFFDVNMPLTLIKLKKSDTQIEYEYYSTLHGDDKRDYIDLPESEGGVLGFAGFTPIASGWLSDGFLFTVSLYDKQDDCSIGTIQEGYLEPINTWMAFSIPPEYCSDQYCIRISISNLEGCNDIGDWFDLVLCYDSTLSE